MMIGESPGAEEDRVGRPFVGRSGRYLDDVLEEFQLSRRSIFITGSIKCHPPGNRDPRKVELKSCRPHLDGQVKALSPRVIVLLGRIASREFIGGSRLERIRGRITVLGDKILLPTYHPAAAMRFPAKRKPFRDDISTLASLLREIQEYS
jgi:DNA polymerase